MQFDNETLTRLANCVRVLSFDAVEQAKSGHPGMPMGMADAATVLFAEFLKFDASTPKWPDRDRFVLSNGHGSMLLYSLLHLTGYPEMSIEQIKNFRQLGSITPGHPEYGETPGVETTTGPLGQGIANAVGMAIAETRLAKEFGDDLVDHRTWVFTGDGCLMEGVGQEAVSLAGHLGLEKLIVVFDDNSITIDGGTELARSEDVVAKFQASNWRVIEADGHDLDSIRQAYAQAIEANGQPVLIDLKTVIGFGAPHKQGTAGVHGSPLGSEEQQAARQELGWEAEPFVIPAELGKLWQDIGSKGREQHQQWHKRLAASEQQEEFNRRNHNELPTDFASVVRKQVNEWSNNPSKIATRKASQDSLEVLVGQLPELIGGSADLTGSNLTKTSTMQVYSKANPERYIHFGVREFAMCAALNGINVHGGLIGYGGTFLVFTDYARNAIRLAAMMQTRSIFVMTHDSIGLGEDGPTHQPIEHLASLRAIPQLLVMRPADRVETLECWEIAVSHPGPSVLALTRQGVEQVRLEETQENLCHQGAYLLRNPQQRDLTILATGSEVQIALAAADQLADHGKQAAVVSMPCWELFATQDDTYQQEVLGNAPKIAIEAAGKFGWTRYVESEDHVIGIDGFGVSAPINDAYQHLGITAAAVVAKANSLT